MYVIQYKASIHKVSYQPSQGAMHTNLLRCGALTVLVHMNAQVGKYIFYSALVDSMIWSSSGFSQDTSPLETLW